MVIKRVCPLTRKECAEDGCIDWTPTNRKIFICQFWEDETTGEHCRLKRAVNTVLADYDRIREEKRRQPVDVPFDV